MKRLWITLPATLLALALHTTHAQQVADLIYQPPIERPTYALGTGPLVVIDEGHNNFHTVNGRYLPFSNLLRRDGYRVEGFTGTITREKLEGVSVFVIANPVHASNVNNWVLPTPSAYTAAEIEVLHEWVEDGGSLFLIADHMPFPGGAGNLALAFGAYYSNGYASTGFSNGWVDVFTPERGLAASFITEGRPGDVPVTSVGTFGGSAFRLPEGATPVLLFGEGAISRETPRAPGVEPGSPEVNVNGWSQGAVLESGYGRVALFGEAAMFSAQLAGATQRTMGMNDADAAQNYRLLLNLLRWLSRADVIVDLNPKDALYDSDVQGLVTDDGSGPLSGSNPSGLPAIDDNVNNAHRHDLGFTLHIAFTPAEADLQGTRLLIELGAHINGSGLYLIDGVPTLLSKQNSSSAQVPDSLNDTALPAIAVQSTIGVLEAGVPYVFSAAWDHNGTLELKASENQGAAVIDTFTISGTPGNWSGNDTLNVRTPHRDNLGGLSGAGTGQNYGHPFDVDNVAAFEGEIARALFWNDYALTPTGLTAPQVKGFAVTTLPSQGKVRLHWNLSLGILDDLVPTVTVRDAADAVLLSAEVTAGIGYYDVESSERVFTLVASNETGESAPVAAALAELTPYAQAVQTASPVLWYRFNEAAGEAWAIDSADNAVPFNGVATSAALSGGEGIIDGVGIFGSGAIETGLVFDPAAFATQKPHGGFSIEAILSLSSEHNALTALVSQKDVSGTGRNIFGVLGDDKLFNFLGAKSYKTSAAPLAKNRWVHVVLVVDAGADEVRWYVDGQLSGRTAGSSLGIESSQGGWVIGANKFLGTPFKGLVDELAIYDSLLDDPDANGNTADSLIAAHRNAWWQHSATASLSAAQIAPGQSVTLTLNLGEGIETVTIDGVDASVVVVDGKAIVVLTPAETTTYKIVLGGSAGTVVQEVSVNVSDAPLPATAPRIHTATIEGESFVLRFSGQPNTEYRVTASSDLASFDQQIETVRTDADGNATVSIPVFPEQVRRFFRVESID